MKRLQRGILIALEGIDGSGKTTLAKGLQTAFEALGLPVLLTKEPGSTALGKEIRKVVQSASYSILPLSEMLLFSADRAQHLAERVKPALDKGYLVISDRMADSSRAYQGYGRHVDREKLEQLIEWTMQGIKPDITLYLILDSQTAWQRITSRKDRLTRFEKLDLTFYDNVIKGFEAIFAERDDVIRIDASQDSEVVAVESQQILMEWLTKKKLIV